MNISTQDKDLDAFLTIIRRLKGIDLSSYRKSFLLRRLNYRVRSTNSENLLQYLNLIKRDDAEFKRFLDTLAINFSEFFRDPDVFDYFRKNCLSEIINRKELSSSKTIRIWSAGCSQGQEAYSLAILLKEALSEKKNFSAKIWGTDIDKDALASAREGEYDLRSLKEMNKARINKYFSSLSSGLFRLNDEIRQMVRFSQSNLVDDSCLRHMDAIFCRNVMIYFSRKQQDTLLSKFYNALKPGAYLVIGRIETISADLKDIFILVAMKYRIFQKKDKK